MTYALVLVQKENAINPWPEAIDFYTKEMPNDQGIEKMNESAWLINLDTDLLSLANLVRISHEKKLKCHCLFFDEKPTFSSEPAPKV